MLSSFFFCSTGTTQVQILWIWWTEIIVVVRVKYRGGNDVKTLHIEFEIKWEYYLCILTKAQPEISTFTVKPLDNSLNCSCSLNFNAFHATSPRASLSAFASFLWGLVYLDFPLHCSTPTCSFPTAHLHLQPVFINFFHKAQQNRGRGASLLAGRLTQPGTLSMNFSSSPSPSVIDKQSFPYAEEGVMALTEGGMLWGENIVQQWHRSNLGLTEWFHQGLLLPQSVWPRGPCQRCC